MSGARKSPRTRDRLLGAQLKAIRTEHTPLSLEKAAALVQQSLATMSRIENGRRHITDADVAALLTAYRAPRHLRRSLIDTARSGVQDGVWKTTADADGIAVLQAAAHRMTEWSITAIPPLLQTATYAAALLRATVQRPEDVEAKLRRRHRCQQALGQIDYTAFIHESALSTASEQLTHLIRSIDRGIGVRIVQHRVPAHLVAAHPWMLLEFPKDPPVVHLQLQQVGLYLHEPESTAYSALRAHLTRVACACQESRRILSELATRRG